MCGHVCNGIDNESKLTLTRSLIDDGRANDSGVKPIVCHVLAKCALQIKMAWQKTIIVIYVGLKVT